MKNEKKYYSKKNNVIMLMLIALIAVFALASAIIDSRARSGLYASGTLDLPIYCVKTDKKKLSITFDAAWGDEDTGELISILGRYNVKATFFVIGKWAEKYPDSVSALSNAGHEIMNHSYDHAHYPALSSVEMVRDANRASEAISALTSVRPNLFRAPYGDYDANVVTTMRNAGYYTIQWDVDSLDWKDLPADEIQSRVLSNAAPGSIILFHNAALHTPEALPGIIEGLLGEGYEIVPVSQLIYKKDYTMNHEGRQIANESE